MKFSVHVSIQSDEGHVGLGYTGFGGLDQSQAQVLFEKLKALGGGIQHQFSTGHVPDCTEDHDADQDCVIECPDGCCQIQVERVEAEGCQRCGNKHADYDPRYHVLAECNAIAAKRQQPIHVHAFPPFRRPCCGP